MISIEPARFDPLRYDSKGVDTYRINCSKLAINSKLAS